MVIVDASQSLGAVPLDVATLRPDFVVSVGYKWLLGPLGRGLLWVAPKHRDGQPLEENRIVRKDAEQFARLIDYRDEYQPGARPAGCTSSMKIILDELCGTAGWHRDHTRTP